MANPSLPDEIKVEIFSRLPSKSIGKFKCLSKFWLSFLSTPHFINLRLAHKGNLLLVTPSHSLYMVTPKIDNNAISRKIELPGSWTEVVGSSCKGLVLLFNKEGELYLVNPITSIVVKIPVLVAPTRVKSPGIHGLGYDSSSDDYNIVTLSFIDRICGNGTTFVHVYSVKNGVWKMVCFPCEYAGYIPEYSPELHGAYVNGAIHWLFTNPDGPSIILAFDLATEAFEEIRVPFLIRQMMKRLIVRSGRLCVVDSIQNGCGDVWTMEEYGKVESWKKITMAKNDVWDQVRPLCFAGEDLLMLTSGDGILVVYDVKEETMKEFVIDGASNYCKDEDDYAENLVDV